jgi:hypothetical protein
MTAFLMGASERTRFGGRESPTFQEAVRMVSGRFACALASKDTRDRRKTSGNSACRQGKE